MKHNIATDHKNCEPTTLRKDETTARSRKNEKQWDWNIAISLQLLTVPSQAQNEYQRP